MIRNAATLICTIPNHSGTFRGDYGVLMMKRTPKASFMPSRYVFPGGAVSRSADGAEEWMKSFKLWILK